MARELALDRQRLNHVVAALVMLDEDEGLLKQALPHDLRQDITWLRQFTGGLLAMLEGRLEEAGE